MKKNVLVDVRVVVETPMYIRQVSGIMRQAKMLDEWARDFKEFVRDHRSQDPVDLSIERIYQDQCSFCESRWEVDSDGPSCCEAARAEWVQTSHAKV